MLKKPPEEENLVIVLFPAVSAHLRSQLHLKRALLLSCVKTLQEFCSRSITRTASAWILVYCSVPTLRLLPRKGKRPTFIITYLHSCKSAWMCFTHCCCFIRDADEQIMNKVETHPEAIWSPWTPWTRRRFSAPRSAVGIVNNASKKNL